MKKQLTTITLALVAGITLTHGALIDVVTFNHADGLPQEYLDFLWKRGTPNLLFFDEALASGWVSKYGKLNGGQFFFTEVSGTDPTATVSWDFGASGFWMTYIDIFGTDANGDPWSNLYRVPYGFRYEDINTVQLNGTVHIYSIAFYGIDEAHRRVPDAGSTACLFSLALVGVLLLARQPK